jgi:hypothetical protein
MDLCTNCGSPLNKCKCRFCNDCGEQIAQDNTTWLCDKCVNVDIPAKFAPEEPPPKPIAYGGAEDPWNEPRS